MNSQEIQLPENHREILDRFVAACQADDRIVAAFIGGSYATGKVDEHSDLDLFFITTDSAYGDFILERERFACLLGEPLFRESFGLDHGYCLIFSNMSECEFWFGRESNFKGIYSGPYKVLLDKKGILAGEVFPAHMADPVRQVELLRQQIDWFWHELSHFMKAMARRQLWFAYGELEALRQICVTLARLRYDFSDDHIRGEPYFKIEQALPTQELASLQSTFCPMEYQAMLQAALVICRFYQDVAPGLAKAHHLPYQTDLERIMIGQLRELSRAGSILPPQT
ncbi:MAG: aminoglycoside 6-adenylyltransferase [Bacteroidota bacterium]